MPIFSELHTVNVRTFNTFFTFPHSHIRAEKYFMCGMKNPIHLKLAASGLETMPKIVIVDNFDIKDLLELN